MRAKGISAEEVFVGKPMVIKVRAHAIMSESVIVSDCRTELFGQGCEERLF